MSKNIVVIGAGITGVLSAYYLVKAGYSVTVIDQERYPAMKTSFANGGQVSVSNSEVWTTWNNIYKGVKWIFKKDAPLLIRPTPSIAKIKWLSQFLFHTIKGDYESNTQKTIKLGLESRKLYSKIIEEEQINFDQSYCGILHFYKDRDYFNNAEKAKTIYNQNGCDWDIVSPTEIKNIDNSLKDIPNIIGGAWTKSDWTGDIHKFCKELSKVLELKYNVKFTFDNKITSENLQKLLSEYDNVIISAGVGSINLSKIIGDSLSVYPVKGYSITIRIKPEELHLVPKTSLLDDQAKIVTSTLGNRFRVAGTAELNGENYDIRRDRIEPLLNWVAVNFPNLDISDYSSWACLRPMTPNMMPIIKQSKSNKKVFYHTGHGHLGWTFSPATAHYLTEIIKNER